MTHDVTTEDEVILWRCMKCAKWSFAGRKPRCHTRRADGRSQWCGPFRKWIARKS